MEYFVLCISVSLSIIIWPFNRWAMKKGGRTQSIGLVISFTASVLAAAGALITGESPGLNIVMLIGAVMGVAYAVGFCTIIFYCLKIGPSGPTVTLNNLGLIFPVLLSLFFYSNGKTPGALAIIGIAMTVSALILMAFNRSDGDNTMTLKWFKWAIAGWLLSGLSMSAQFLATYYTPKYPYSFAFYAFMTSFIILAVVILVKKDSRPRKEELITGTVTGVINVACTPLLFYLVKHIPAYVVFPINMAAPILAMLLAGHFIYKEKLNHYGWLACICGMVGLIIFNI